MKPTGRELRVGNKVAVYSQNRKNSSDYYLGVITSIATYGIEYNYEGPRLNHCTFGPIPITRELLIKIGCTGGLNGSYKLGVEIKHFGTKYFIIGPEVVGEWGLFIDEMKSSSLLRDIKYFHQLQNIIFDLTEIELSI